MPVTVQNSSQIGFLRPGSGRIFSLDAPVLGFDVATWYNEPTSGQSLDNLFQQIVAGVTGLDQTLVRPRWQREPPPVPPFELTWCAVGVTNTVPQGFPAGIYDGSFPPGDGSMKMVDWEEFDVLCSFYGPEADKYALRLREGMFVETNRSCLVLLGMAFVSTSGRQRVPALVQMQNYERYDITLNMRRSIQEEYPILYILSAPIHLVTGEGVVSDRS